MLTSEMRKSLKELTLGLKGELTISPDMEDLMNSFMLDTVPARWEKRAYPSMLGLTAWFANLQSVILNSERIPLFYARLGFQTLCISPYQGPGGVDGRLQSAQHGLAGRALQSAIILDSRYATDESKE